MEKLVAGLQVIGDIADMGMVYGLGITPGIWKLNESEATVFARIIARKADEGNAQAVAQLEKLVDAADYVAAANIAISKTVDTVLEVKENGVRPFWISK